MCFLLRLSFNTNFSGIKAKSISIKYKNQSKTEELVGTDISFNSALQFSTSEDK